MQEEGKLKPVKASEFEKIITAEKVLKEAGLIEELRKWFKNEKKRIDLPLMLDMYMKLYPDTVLPPKKKKKEKGKGKKKEVEVEEINPIELVTGLIDDLISSVVLEAEEKENARIEERRLIYEAEKKARLQAKYGKEIADDTQDTTGEEFYEGDEENNTKRKTVNLVGITNDEKIDKKKDSEGKRIKGGERKRSSEMKRDSK